jgi:serine phosphatase RsbU (regulator of sigma subunit)
MKGLTTYRPVTVFMIMLLLLLPASLNSQFQGIIFPDIYAQDSIRASELLGQARNRFAVDSLESALELADEALQYAMRAGDTETEIGILSLIGEVYGLGAQPGDAIPYYLRAVNILETRNDTLPLPPMYSRIAHSYHLEQVYEKEGEHYLNALEYTPETAAHERADLVEKIGLATLRSGLSDSAITHFTRLNDMMEEMGRDNSPVLQYLVRANNSAGKHEKALEYNEILFDRSRSSLNYKEMSTIKNNMGYNLTILKNYGEAVLAYQEAIDYGEQAGLPDRELALTMTNAGICYQNMNQTRKAKTNFRRAIRDLDNAGDWSEKSRVENIMAMIYYMEGDLYNAGQFSRAAIESSRRAEHQQYLSDAYLTYSRVLREGNDPIQALEFYEKHLSIRDSLELEARLREDALTRRKDELERSERDLILKLKEERVKELAIQQLELEKDRVEQEKELIRQESENRELEQERLEQDLVITRQQHEVERQQRIQRVLEQQAQLDSLRQARIQAEQAREIQDLENKQTLDQLELERQKQAKKALGLISVLGVLLTILIAASLMTTRKKNALLGKQKAEIEEQNRNLEQKNEEISSQRDEIEAQRDMLSNQKEEIEHINREIMKSLEYASKIQTSTLPDLGSLEPLIRDHFLLFRPRDIVSGDFFWTATVEGTTVITVADCTGHGVPGAFMSMLGMSLLKEIVQKEYITHPGVILRRLRKEVISALGQKGHTGEQRDGMDMALITLSQDSEKLQYAGAYNPLYIIRKKELPPPGDGEFTVTEATRGDNGYLLYEIIADKMPISYFLKMDKFTSRELDLEKGDRLYLFSDGYPDQFGGPRGKKFKYKPFKQMLLQHAHLSMPEQLQILSSTLDEWQGTHPQIDDICVIGLAI